MTWKKPLLFIVVCCCLLVASGILWSPADANGTVEITGKIITGLVACQTATTPAKVLNGTPYEFKLPQVSTTLNITPSDDIPAGTSVMVSKYNSSSWGPTAPSTSTYKALGVYLVIESPGLSGKIHEMNITFHYTDAELAASGATEANLGIYYFNPSTNAWDPNPLPPPGVDKDNNIVWGITDHLSIYGVFASIPSAPGGGGPGGGGPGGGGPGGGGGGGGAPGAPAVFGEAAPALGATVITPVSKVGKLQTVSITADVAGMNDITALWSAYITSAPPNGTIFTTIIKSSPSTSTRSAFDAALGRNAFEMTGLAYVMEVKVSNTTTTGPATIQMDANRSWVTKAGGVDAIQIIRQGDNGVVEILTTSFSNYVTGTAYMNFKATSPSGLSVFALIGMKGIPAGVTTVPTTVGVPVTTIIAGTPAPTMAPVHFPTIPVIGVIIVILAIVAGIIIVKRARKKQG